MPIEKTYTIPDNEEEIIVQSDSYFCYDCNTEKKISFDNSPLKPCRCGHRIFYIV